jgi:uncharacterized protein
MRLTVRVHPGARGDEVGGRYGSGEPPVLIVRVAAPARDGQANERLVHVLAHAFDVPRGAVTVVAGARGRTKVVDVRGADPDLVARFLTR